MKWDALARIGLALPETEESTSYGTPALKVRGKTFVRLREDGKDVVFMLANVDEQEHLIEANPALYHITDHYKGWASVLARLSKLSIGEARVRLTNAWRLKAPKTLVRQFDARG
ncbi:MAG: MmcQ/YjbR family DNA-binding protein [Hyphomonadaceae bacterium]